jgi:hypothetical protein
MIELYLRSPRGTQSLTIQKNVILKCFGNNLKITTPIGKIKRKITTYSPYKSKPKNKLNLLH